MGDGVDLGYDSLLLFLRSAVACAICWQFVSCRERSRTKWPDVAICRSYGYCKGKYRQFMALMKISEKHLKKQDFAKCYDSFLEYLITFLEEII